jgi:hypothetical protein
VRRYQDRQRERFLAGTHPHQACIEEHLSSSDVAASSRPDAAVWRTEWDEAPWVFLGLDSPTPPRSPASS